jgi:predicted dehydrogenase
MTSLPASRIADPHLAPAIRWGIMAPGRIAHAFARAVSVGTASKVVAVGSRSLERAQAFADTHGVAAAYGSYEEVAADPDVDAVYIASPHSGHLEHALIAIEGGKPVLVEKPFTRSAAEARQVFDAAAARGVFAMEAMWSRCLPQYDVVRQAVEGGLLGDIVSVSADHGQPLHPDGPRRLSDPALAGGALLDLGVYPLAFADLVLGGFDSITAVGTLTEEGVDSTASILVAGPSGASGLVATTMLSHTPCTATVVGTRANILLDPTFYQPTTVRLLSRTGEVLDVRDESLPHHVHGFSYEAAEVAWCLAEGTSESGLVPQAATLRVMDAMDEVRRQIGVVYPGE